MGQQYRPQGSPAAPRVCPHRAGDSPGPAYVSPDPSRLPRPRAKRGRSGHGYPKPGLSPPARPRSRTPRRGVRRGRVPAARRGARGTERFLRAPTAGAACTRHPASAGLTHGRKTGREGSHRATSHVCSQSSTITGQTAVTSGERRERWCH